MPSTALHPATLQPCACHRQRTRHIYAYVLLTHVSYFSRGPKLRSENGPSPMRDLRHEMIADRPANISNLHWVQVVHQNTSFSLLLSDLLNIINYGSFISIMLLQFGQIFHHLLSLSCEPLFIGCDSFQVHRPCNFSY